MQAHSLRLNVFPRPPLTKPTEVCIAMAHVAEKHQDVCITAGSAFDCKSGVPEAVSRAHLQKEALIRAHSAPEAKRRKQADVSQATGVLSFFSPVRTTAPPARASAPGQLPPDLGRTPAAPPGGRWCRSTRLSSCCKIFSQSQQNKAKDGRREQENKKATTSTSKRDLSIQISDPI